MQLIRDCSIEMVKKYMKLIQPKNGKTPNLEEKVTEDKTDTEILNQLKILKDELLRLTII